MIARARTLPQRTRHFALLLALLSGACAASALKTSIAPVTRETAADAIDAAFRIDLSDVDVTYDLDFGAGDLVGRAALTFRMRPGQSRPLFHFNPSVPNGTVRSTLTGMVLNGEAFDPADPRVLTGTRFPGSSERGFEIQRALDPDVVHELEISWTIAGALDTSWFKSNVDDCTGAGNEALWPTINSPEELARHRVRLRIHSDQEYVALGSGALTRSSETLDSKTVQIFELDSGREISSYTMMVAAMPAAEVSVDRFELDGTPVTLVSTEDDGDNGVARAMIKRTFSRLVHDFGPYPMPFLQILLLDWDDGMEYYGATITGIDALEHEIVHMYWGCSAIARTWRDTWIDEALAVWWLERNDLDPLPEGFASDMVSSRSVIESAFDLRAYDEGAMIIARTAEAIGGDDALIEFLADFHRRRAFKPFTTLEFVDDLVQASEQPELRERFQRWLYAA